MPVSLRDGAPGISGCSEGLRQLNETLEEEIKRIAYAVHDEAGQLLVAVHLALAEVARNYRRFSNSRSGGSANC